MRALRTLALLGAVIGALAFLSPPAWARQSGADALPGQTAPRPELEAYRSAVVKLDSRAVPGAPSSETLGARRSGTGVIVGQNLVLTIGYLLLEADDVEVTTASGKKLPGTVAGYDHATGFALVRTILPLDGKVLALGDSDRVGEYEKVLTIGQGEPAATELLVVSRKRFSGSWEYMVERPIFTFPPVNNWSGSALISHGQLVGIGSLIVGDAAADRRGVPGNMFVPVNLLKPILDDLVKHGRRSGPAQPWLGVGTEMVGGHLMVTHVSDEGPAQAAGVAAGDIVLEIAAARVSDRADFYHRLWNLGPAGTTVALKVLRSGETREINVKSVDRSDVLKKPVGV